MHPPIPIYTPPLIPRTSLNHNLSKIKAIQFVQPEILSSFLNKQLVSKPFDFSNQKQLKSFAHHIF